MKRSAMTQTVSRITLLVALGAGVLAVLVAANSSATAAESAHIMVAPGDVKWMDGPATLPAGSKVAVIEGDPKNPGLFAMRLKLPANYKILPHWHPADEHVTVISGTFNMGMGDTFDETKGSTLPAGSFAVMPAKAHHFAFTKEETVVQIHGIGPWGITYLNPADDPRKK